MIGGEPTGDPRGALAECRAAITELDARMVALLAERVALARRVWALKQAAGLPVLDPAREAEVVRRAMTEARARGLPAEEVRAVFWQIIGLSRRVQEGVQEGEP